MLDQIKSDYVMLFNACLDQQSFSANGENTSEILRPLSENPAMRALFERLTGP